MPACFADIGKLLSCKVARHSCRVAHRRIPHKQDHRLCAHVVGRRLSLDAESKLTLQNNDACFDKAKILFEGEKYVEPSRHASPPELQL